MRITKGHLRFSRKEVWNLSEHLAKCIHDGLLQFKNSDRLGFPADISSKTWEEYLDKMIFSFKEISTFYRNDPIELYFNKVWNTGERDLKKFKAPDEVCEESKKYYKDIKEGIKLFSKYYTDLWD